MKRTMRFPSDPVSDGMLLSGHDPNDPKTIRREVALEILHLLAEYSEDKCVIEQSEIDSAISDVVDEIKTSVTEYRDEVVSWYEDARDTALESSVTELEDNLPDPLEVPEHNIDSDTIDIDISSSAETLIDLMDDALLFKLSNMFDISITELKLMLNE